jgi:hypothetical protein
MSGHSEERLKHISPRDFQKIATITKTFAFGLFISAKMGFFTMDADSTLPTKGAWANRKCLCIVFVYCLAGFQ